MEEQLKRVLAAHSLPCAAVIAAPGLVAARIGDFAAVGSPGLVSSLLGPDGSPAATLGGLAGQELPQLWEEGDAFAFIDQPAPDLAVVVFGRGQGGGSWAELVRLSLAVGLTIREEFGEARAGPALPR
jgi:hypothetical protein